MPTISVLIPAYNVGRFIEETLASVAAQTRLPDEVIVVDDGSTDDTADKVNRFQRSGSLPIRLIRRSNGGAAAARNTGFRTVSTELVACLDGDDLYLPHHLELLESAFFDYPDLVLAFGDLRCLAAEGAPHRVNIFEAARMQRVPYDPLPNGFRLILGSAFQTLIEGCYLVPTSALFRTSAAARIGFMSESFPVRNDLEFFLRLSRQGGFAYTPRAVGVFRRHQTNISDERRLVYQMLWNCKCLAKMARMKDLLHLEAEEEETLDRAQRARLIDLAWISSRRGMLPYLRAARDAASDGSWLPFLNPRHVLRSIMFTFWPDREAQF